MLSARPDQAAWAKTVVKSGREGGLNGTIVDYNYLTDRIGLRKDRINCLGQQVDSVVSRDDYGN